MKQPSGSPASLTKESDGRQTTSSIWSAISHANDPDDPKYQDAWTKLVERYRPVIAAQTRRYFRQDFEDLTQDFLAGRFLFQLIPTVDKSSGFKFRTCLAKCLRSFLIDELRKRFAEKRGGKVTILSLDQVREESELIAEIESDEFERTLDKRIANSAFDRAFEAVKARYAAKKKVKEFDLLTGSAGDYSDEKIRQSLEIGAGAVRARRFQLRNRLEAALRAEVADLVLPEQFEEEYRYLNSLID